MVHLLRWPCVFVVLVIAAVAVSSGTAQAIPPLDEDQLQALSVINERTVRSTVSFLASDELGGRGTPSPGFTVACAFVASRFEAAGLDGGATDGSFFQRHELQTIQMPTRGVALSGLKGHSISHLGVIAAGDQWTRFEGPLEKFSSWDAWNELPDEKKKRPGQAVVIDAGQPGDYRLMSRQWKRRANRLKASGVPVLLLAVDPNDQLVRLAGQLTDSPRWSRNASEDELPILLVDRETSISGPVSITIPPVSRGSATVSNVIGVLPGGDPKLAGEAVVFSAHLDHLGTRDNGTPDSVYNGADDNASGVTGVLSLADAFGALQSNPARTTLFVAFWGEEQGLLGSRFLVDNPVWPLNKTVAMINLEMIGRPEPGARHKAWMTGWEYSDLGTAMAAGSSRAEVEIFEHPSFSGQLYRASDNWPFVEAGVIAHSFSAGSLHDDYHQPADHWEKLETEHMTRVIQGLFAGALPIADGILTPTGRSRD